MSEVCKVCGAPMENGKCTFCGAVEGQEYAPERNWVSTDATAKEEKFTLHLDPSEDMSREQMEQEARNDEAAVLKAQGVNPEEVEKLTTPEPSLEVTEDGLRLMPRKPVERDAASNPGNADSWHTPISVAPTNPNFGQNQPGEPGVLAEGDSPKSKWTAAILCFFLGSLGVHRFYVGKIGTGILYLCTGALFGIGWIVDLILIVCGSFKDSEGKILSI